MEKFEREVKQWSILWLNLIVPPPFSNLILHHSNLHSYRLSIQNIRLHSSYRVLPIKEQRPILQHSCNPFFSRTRFIVISTRESPREEIKGEIESNSIPLDTNCSKLFSRTSGENLSSYTCLARYRGHMALIFLLYCRHVGNEGESKGGESEHRHLFFLAWNRTNIRALPRVFNPPCNLPSNVSGVQILRIDLAI